MAENDDRQSEGTQNPSLSLFETNNGKHKYRFQPLEESRDKFLEQVDVRKYQRLHFERKCNGLSIPFHSKLSPLFSILPAPPPPPASVRRREDGMWSSADMGTSLLQQHAAASARSLAVNILLGIYFHHILHGVLPLHFSS
ncbi:hypothetical protein AVEN_168666-1 [Araneus ventricosus]|uniref:Uncharacterized protein n=1 Tax=Araneus ventricosus TaxID=182803 RepID=A0A4Y2M092_ARAVE|nr:hypothetical protein AVEN_168666-1 [Araneus ventricosus]